MKDALVKATDAGNTVSLELTAAVGLSESDPITYTKIKHEFTASVRAGGVTWYKLAYESGAYIVFSSANAVVTYAGNEYKAGAGEKIYYLYTTDHPVKVTVTASASTVELRNADSGKAITGECSVLLSQSLCIELSATTAATTTLEVSARNYRMSLLGDSISTFAAYSNNPQYNASLSSNGSIYYPTSGSIPAADEFTVEDTYWKKL